MQTQSVDAESESRAERFSSILVPVDGSPESLEAIGYAARFRADRILVLRVEVDQPSDDQGEDDAYARWSREHLARVNQDLQDQVASNKGAAATVEYKIRYGNPAEQIISEGQDHDLIVMSSSGKGAAGRLLFGSVTDRVSRFGTTPTLVIRASRNRAAAGPSERVVVPLDGSELAERAIPLARRAALAASLPIHLVRCVGMDETLQTVRKLRKEAGNIYNLGDEPYEIARKQTEAEAVAYLESVRDQLAAEGLEVTIELLGGTASFELLEAINDRDIVVVTSRGHGGIQRWMLGSVSERLLREAKAPVMLVPVGRTGNEGRTETA